MRWQPDAFGRLHEAALALFEEQGFENTTVAEIAERAGLTKRTFFRYFADKREVLFGGAQAFEESIVTAVTEAPESAAPLDAVRAGLHAATDRLGPRREFASRRQRIIAASPELHERELIKMASLTAAVGEALRGRGVGDPAAILTAEAGIAVFRVAFERWATSADERGLEELIDDSLDELRAATAA
jgi:AcrR family transcriptional regulator